MLIKSTFLDTARPTHDMTWWWLNRISGNHSDRFGGRWWQPAEQANITPDICMVTLYQTTKFRSTNNIVAIVILGSILNLFLTNIYSYTLLYTWADPRGGVGDETAASHPSVVCTAIGAIASQLYTPNHYAALFSTYNHQLTL